MKTAGTAPCDAEAYRNLHQECGQPLTEYLIAIALRNALESNGDDSSTLYDDTCEGLRDAASLIAETVARLFRPQAFASAVGVSDLTR